MQLSRSEGIFLLVRRPITLKSELSISLLLKIEMIPDFWMATWKLHFSLWLRSLIYIGFLEILRMEVFILQSIGSHVSFRNVFRSMITDHFPVPENMTSRIYNLENNSSSIILDHKDTYSPVVFHAATKVSILCLPGTLKEEDTYLRTVIVFDGPDTNSPFLGRFVSYISDSN